MKRINKFGHGLSFRARVFLVFLCMNLLTVISYSVYNYKATLSKALESIDSMLYHVGRTYPAIVGGDVLSRLMQDGSKAFDKEVYSQKVSMQWI